MPDSESPYSEYFQKTRSGRIAFYPWGILSKGFVVPDKRARDKAVSFVSMYIAIGLVLIFFVDRLVNGRMAVISFAVVLVGYGIGIRTVTRGWPRTSERLRLSEVLRKQAQRQSLLVLLAGAGFSAMLIGAGVAVMA